MYYFVLIFLCLAPLDPPHIPTPNRYTVDHRVRRLCRDEVRKDPKLLVETLDDIWIMIPDMVSGKNPETGAQLGILAYFISLEQPNIDRRVENRGRDLVTPVFSMLVNVGLPSVPALLDQLLIVDDNSKDSRNHREMVVRCIVEIYDKGGDGRRMTVERIKMYAEDNTPEMKKRILAALDHIPKPVKLPPK